MQDRVRTPADGVIPPIIERARFEAVQALRAVDVKVVVHPHDHAPRFEIRARIPLRGLGD